MPNVWVQARRASRLGKGGMPSASPSSWSSLWANSWYTTLVPVSGFSTWRRTVCQSSSTGPRPWPDWPAKYCGPDVTTPDVGPARTPRVMIVRPCNTIGFTFRKGSARSSNPAASSAAWEATVNTISSETSTSRAPSQWARRISRSPCTRNRSRSTSERRPNSAGAAATRPLRRSASTATVCRDRAVGSGQFRVGGPLGARCAR